ncbi:Sodium/calcium exchanger protein [Tritrichomonas foetus]|uniref:Sodium/calcium exchanger protein n=1 Tax=Tritrichomonas foetus TaxID=1144522 RepID=A0A1J4KUI7_9EUKA|nr:Sodium/calcium exchanger protein [Tritrichomonas foetus]|eukprot:OHT14935.1 Sodium/calcium exchanger protein [Tritrichomonas foetus]
MHSKKKFIRSKRMKKRKKKKMSFEEFSSPSTTYTNPVSSQPMIPSTKETNLHVDSDDEPHVLGFKPHAPRADINLQAIEQLESFKPHKTYSISNIVWVILIGWWVSLFYVITGILFTLTIYGFKHAKVCFQFALYILYPFNKYISVNGEPSGPENFFTKFLWILFSPIYGVAALLGIAISWELVYFIPMSKALFKVLKLSFKSPTCYEVANLVNHNPQMGKRPVVMFHSSGSSFYFKYSILSFEVVYLNLTPFIVMALICGFLAPKDSFINNPMFGTVMAIVGAVPCAYLIGICVDDLSHQLGLVLGAILNSFFLTVVELILYYFSLQKGLEDVVRSAVTGAFLMNLLIIPGVGMLAAGLKWHETILNRKSQAISGTFLLLSVMAVLFPSVFYHIHSHTNIKCDKCNTSNGIMGTDCTMCSTMQLSNIENDPIYTHYAGPLMTIMACLMPIIYIIGVIFSLKTHPQIYDTPHNNENEVGTTMTKTTAIVILIISTVMFSMMAHVMTEKIPEAIEELGLSQRFVGLVFYTLIPNCAEYMNAVKFALNGNIGLSMEIGNQGAILTALIELPALVLMSYVMKKIFATSMFTLVFPLIDVFCIIIAVFLRNSILTEKSINYFTGISFLVIFLLISVVYYFENINEDEL